MSIDTFKEQVISIDEAAKHIGQLTGQKRNRALITRWARRGVQGVKLRTILIGKDIYTSREALNEFLSESREAKRQKHSNATAAGIRATRAAIDAEAEELGI